MTFSLFNKNRCSITDELFLELTWDDGRGLEEDSELLDIIEGLDHLSNFSQPISKSLPYLTFQQAELLFKELKQAYGRFMLVHSSLLKTIKISCFPLFKRYLLALNLRITAIKKKGSILRTRFILYINKVWDYLILLYPFSQPKVKR